MRSRAFIFTFLVFLLAPNLLHAGDITVGEADLKKYGTSYQINRAGAGDLYVTDWRMGELWRVTPETGAYTRFSGLGSPWDARPDGTGNIWFTQYWFPELVRVNIAANPLTMTTWSFGALDSTRNPADDYIMGGLAFDANGTLWFTESEAASSSKTEQPLYHYDPVAGQLCSYTVAGGLRSYYVLSYDGFIWLGDWKQRRIVRFNPSSPTTGVLYWTLESGSVPRGLAADAGGDIWWADEGTNKLGRLTPGTNTVRTYSLPDAVPLDTPIPYGIAVRDGKIWYTSQGTEAGTIGTLDPATAASDSPPTNHGSTSSTSRCISPQGSDMQVSALPGIFTSWTPQVWTLTPASEVGWTVYQMAGARNPYGILAEGNRLWVTEQSFNRLVRAVLGVSAPQVTIARSGQADVKLTWAPTGGASYRVWYSENPYFSVSGTPAQDSAATAFTDQGIATNLTNHFYVVRAVDAQGAESADSNRTGEFTFPLTKGSS